MKHSILTYTFTLFSIFGFSQNSQVKSLIYPELKTIATKKLDYNKIIPQVTLKYIKDINIKPLWFISFEDCVEGDCKNGEGTFLHVKEDKALDIDNEVSKSLKERRERYFEKRSSAIKRDKTFNRAKYRIPYIDKLQEHRKRLITFVLLKGTFSENGEKFRGKEYTFQVTYTRNGYDYVPETRINFKENIDRNLSYEGEFKKDIFGYHYHGFGKDYIATLDPAIKNVDGLFGSGYPKMILISYQDEQPIKSFLGIPSDNFHGKKEHINIKFKGNFIFGRITFNNGAEYIGGLLNGKYNGIGRLKNLDGSIQQGLWVEGVLKREKEIRFPDVLFSNNLTKIDYKLIELKAEPWEQNKKEYFYFGKLKNNIPTGFGLYINSEYWTQCFIGEIDNRIPGSSYFYYYNFQSQFKSGIRSYKDTWYGVSHTTSNLLIARNHFTLGEMKATSRNQINEIASPNIGYGSSCIKILPSNEDEQMGYFQYPEGWSQTVNGKFLYLAGDGLYDAEDTNYHYKTSKENISKMYKNNIFCSPKFTMEAKIAIIKNQEKKHETSERVKKEMAEFAARQEQAAKAFNNCWQPQIVMNSDPSKTYTYCNGHKTYGERMSASSIRYGDVIQYNGAMYEVNGKTSYGIKLLCDLEISGNYFYVFEKLKNASDALRIYCDCSGYEYVTQSYQVPTGQRSVVYQNSVVKMVKNHTETKSYSFRVKVDCKQQCGGQTCWPSNYALGR